MVRNSAVEPGIVEAFADIAAGRQDKALHVVGDIQRRLRFPAVLRRQAATQNREIADKPGEPVLKTIKVVLALGQHDG